MEAAGKEPGVRVLVVHGDERGEYERSMRGLSIHRTREDLEALRVPVDKGALKSHTQSAWGRSPNCAAITAIGYFHWDLREGKLEFFGHPLNLAREKALEGKYVIRTEESNLSAVKGVTAC